MAASASLRIWRADLFGAGSRAASPGTGGAGNCTSTAGPRNRISSSIRAPRAARPPRATTLPSPLFTSWIRKNCFGCNLYGYIQGRLCMVALRKGKRRRAMVGVSHAPGPLGDRYAHALGRIVQTC